MKCAIEKQTGRRRLRAIMALAIPFVFLIVLPISADEALPGFTALTDADLTVPVDISQERMGCGTNVSAHYTGGFDPQHFDRVNVDVDVQGYLSLNSADLSGRPGKMVIPFEQEVYVHFISETSGYTPDLGWMLHADSVDENATFRGWRSIEAKNKHYIFRHVVDNETSAVCCGSGDGILDTDYGTGYFPTGSEAALAGYDDGSGTKLLIDRDGSVTPRDMKKRIGRFAAGGEIVFFLAIERASESLEDPRVYYNKPWSQDVYEACVPTDGSPLWADQGSGTFHKLYHLADARADNTCITETNWLARPVVDRLFDDFDLRLFGDYRLPLIVGEPFPHMIGGPSEGNTNQWVYGFEDAETTAGAADMDFSDVVFLIDRPNGGSAALNPSQAIRPGNVDAFFTSIDLEVCDYQPAGECAERTSLTYFVSVDLGSTWIAVHRWDSGYLISLNPKGVILRGKAIDSVALDTQDHEYTCRKRRIDLIKSGLTGKQLLWKVEMKSASHDCSPQVLGIQIDAATVTSLTLPAAAPVVQTNVIYAGSVETPVNGWRDYSIRGHLTAREVYHPAQPDRTLSEEHLLWDAGEVLAGSDPDKRIMFFPDIDAHRVVKEHLVDDSGRKIYGDGIQTAFSGVFAHQPVLGTSVRIYDGRPEVFSDQPPLSLAGSFGGTGVIDYASGKWELRFSRPPAAGVPVMADYSWYTLRRSKKSFQPGELTNEMLVLSDEHVWPDGFVNDFNGDDVFDTTVRQTDAEWLVQWTRGYRRPEEYLKKDWLLTGTGPSVPALMVPPGHPRWLSGTAVTDDERQVYAEFREAQKERDSLLFVGSGGGFLHALDAGKFRYGDNPETPLIRENRGYFAWSPKTVDSPSYCENYNGAKCPDYGSGKEIWAFIPAGVLPHLKNNVLSDGNWFSVEISPVISDVFIDTDGDGRSDSWRTVLVGTVGNPAFSVFCLDVTDPHEPAFLWEKPLSEFNRERISPAVARVGRIRDPQAGETIWTAFISLGRPAKGNYPAVYLLDISNGNLIRKVSLGAAVDLNADGMLDAKETNYGHGGILSGQSAIVDADNNGFIDRVYVGSSRGLIYKINIPDDDQDMGLGYSNCVINTDFTDANGRSIAPDHRWQPIYASPTVVVESGLAGNGEIAPLVRVFVGTGDSPHQADMIEGALAQNMFFAFVDETDIGVCDKDDHRLDWFVELPENHRVTTSAFISAGRVYLGTATSDTADVCSGSTPVDDAEGYLSVFDLEGTDIISGRLGDVRFDPLVADEHIYLMMPSGLRSLGSGIYNNKLMSFSQPEAAVRSWEEVR